MAVVLDTHTAIWYLTESNRLSPNALRAIEDSTRMTDPAYLPSICVVELIFLAEKGRVPEAAVEKLLVALKDKGSALRVAPLDSGAAETLRRISREAVPDMPDRIISATALHLDLPLVTRDARLQDSLVRTIR